MPSIEINDALTAAAILVSAIIAIVGWAKAAQKDRDHHIFQRRLEKRLEMFHNLVQALVPLANNQAPFQADATLPEKLATARLSVQLYGFDDENDQYEALVRAIERQNVAEVNKILPNFVATVRRNLRKELGYHS